MAVDEMPIHYPKLACDAGNPSGNPSREIFQTKICKDQYGLRSLPNAVGKIGNDKPHNNIQPSICAYGWRRIS